MWSNLTHVEWPWLRLLAFAFLVPLLWFYLVARLALDAPVLARIRNRRAGDRRRI